MERKYFSDFLKANGLDPATSPLMKEHGDVELYPEYMSDFNKNQIIEADKFLREQAERHKKELKAAQDKKDMIALLSLYVSRKYERNRFKQEYQGSFYSQWTGMVAYGMYDKGTYTIENSNLKLMSSNSNEGIDDVMNKTAESLGLYKFLKL